MVSKAAHQHRPPQSLGKGKADKDKTDRANPPHKAHSLRLVPHKPPLIRRLRPQPKQPLKMDLRAVVIPLRHRLPHKLLRVLRLRHKPLPHGPRQLEVRREPKPQTKPLKPPLRKLMRLPRKLRRPKRLKPHNQQPLRAQPMQGRPKLPLKPLKTRPHRHRTLPLKPLMLAVKRKHNRLPHRLKPPPPRPRMRPHRRRLLPMANPRSKLPPRNRLNLRPLKPNKPLTAPRALPCKPLNNRALRA